MSEQLALLPAYLTAHLQLTLFALLAGSAFSIPAGIVIARARRLERPVLAVASVIQTIPSLALLAIMVPALAALGMRSIGFLPAFIGLTLYSVLPILRNTVTGLSGLDPAMIEAARGVGMTRNQQLWRVEIPLAMPVILAGLRTSTVWTVGIATLSTPVGATSLGNYIFAGLQTRNLNAVLVGCIASAVLALVLDGLVRALGGALLSRRRAPLIAVLASLAMLYAYSGVTFVRGLRGASADRVVVGAKTFTEQYILSDIMAGRIGAATGASVEVVSSLGSTVAFDALLSGEIDVYVEYSGTIWATIMKRASAGVDRAGVLEEVGRFLADEHGVELVGGLGFENAYALAMTRRQAESLRVGRISDLVPHAPRLSIGGDYEFFDRAEWASVRDSYGLAFAEKRTMDPSLMYQAVASNQIDVISAFSTDGRIVALDLVVIEDDRRAIPPYDAVILVGPRLRRERPDVVAALKTLTGTIGADQMRRMNLAVDQDGATPAAVAQEFLRSRPISER
ncbi:MAG: ABC transporter permease subunit [Gemmatimonadetes bacterium]|nr:ABC transporter permease subunit [Gemmatimonadota bacterium]